MADPELEQLVDVIAGRVRAKLAAIASAAPSTHAATAAAAGATAAAERPLRECECLEPPSEETCSGCGGLCAARRPWSVRALEAEGACRVGAGVDVGKVDIELARMI